MKQTNRSVLLMIVCAVVFLGAALVTLRAAARAVAPAAVQQTEAGAKSAPQASAPEESATIVDDPTSSPDARQSADHDVSFPTDI